MNKQQNRRNIQVSVELHEDLSYLQANLRVLMMGKNIPNISSKTAITKVVEALIKTADIPTLVKFLKNK